jgi:uncharacterized membrane protein
MSYRIIAAAALLALAACQQGAPGGDQSRLPGDANSTAPFAGIGEDELLRFTGTEPFWGGQVAGRLLTYTTPETTEGSSITVERFAGRGGLSFTGQLDGRGFDMAVTEGSCSDGMSDRTYPFTVTLRLGDETRAGCGWSAERPFSGPEAP